MPSFLENFRSVLSETNTAPLAGTVRNTIPERGNGPSAEDVAQINAQRRQDANNKHAESIQRQRAAEAGSIREYGYDSPGRVAAHNAQRYVSDDIRHFLDEKVFENYDLLNQMADEYEKIQNYREGENVLKKYYDKIDGKTSNLNRMFDKFAYGNKDLMAQENPAAPKQVADYMRYIFDSAKAQYAPRKI